MKVRTKKCTKCGEIKPLTEYCVMSKAPDGLAYWCNSCRHDYRKAYRSTKRGKEVRARYASSEKGKAMLARYKASPKGKASVEKSNTRIPPAVYQIRCLINQRVYIGESGKPVVRKNKHWSLLRHNKHVNRYLQDDWNEFGEDQFVFEILECPKPEALLDCERYWIDRTSANNYNIYCI